MARTDKPLAWVGSSLDAVKAFPEHARRAAGFQLRRVQLGLEPTDWKPMATIGPGVREIRIRVEGAHRVFYVAHFSEAVYVLHAFEKKGRKTSKRDVELGRDRYQQLLAARQEKP